MYKFQCNTTTYQNKITGQNYIINFHKISFEKLCNVTLCHIITLLVCQNNVFELEKYYLRSKVIGKYMICCTMSS